MEKKSTLIMGTPHGGYRFIKRLGTLYREHLKNVTDIIYIVENGGALIASEGQKLQQEIRSINKKFGLFDSNEFTTIFKKRSHDVAYKESALIRQHGLFEFGPGETLWFCDQKKIYIKIKNKKYHVDIIIDPDKVNL